MLGKILRLSFALVGTLALSPLAALAAPAQVIIIRHAEKTSDGSELNDRGFRRADALVGYFTTNPAVLEFGTPAAIYATRPKHAGSSVRQIQTVTPLAKKLQLKINHEFTKREIEELASDILNNRRYEGRMVLISWSHTQIPEIAEALGLDRAPTWSDDTFDRTWVLTFRGDRVESLRDVPQDLLEGDSH